MGFLSNALGGGGSSGGGGQTQTYGREFKAIFKRARHVFDQNFLILEDVFKCNIVSLKALPRSLCNKTLRTTYIIFCLRF